LAGAVTDLKTTLPIGSIVAMVQQATSVPRTALLRSSQLLPALRKRERTWGLLGNPAAFGQGSRTALGTSPSLLQL